VTLKRLTKFFLKNKKKEMKEKKEKKDKDIVSQNLPFLSLLCVKSIMSLSLHGVKVFRS